MGSGARNLPCYVVLAILRLAWKASPLVLLTALSLPRITFSQYAVNNTCPLHCKCTDSLITCTGVIPLAVPGSVHEILLKEIDTHEFYTRRFCHVDWENVTKLSITTSDESQSYFSLDIGVFLCLEFISSFKLQSSSLAHFSKGAFTGLSDVSTFDLSACRKILWNDLFETLTVASDLPKLTHLILSGAGMYDKLVISQAFINALEPRPVLFLDLSYTSFELDFTNTSRLCDTLTTFKAVGSTSEGSDIFLNESHPCESLRELDISESLFLKAEVQNFSCVNSSKPFKFYAPFFKAVRKVHMDSIVTSQSKCIMLNCSIDLFSNTSVLELSFKNNYLSTWDVYFINNDLKRLDISSNRIQSVNPFALENLKGTEVLDLSNNELSKTEDFIRTFSVLFTNSRNLRKLYLGSNQFLYLPKGLFSNIRALKEVHLSNNLLQQIDFDVGHLLNMTLLDFQNNKIKYLNKHSRDSLETLHKRQKDRKLDTIRVLLQGNPFSCECKYSDFLRWFVKSPIFSAYRDALFCKLDGHLIPMNESAVVASREDCARAERRRIVHILLSTVPAAGGLLTFVLAIIMWNRRKRQQLQEKFQMGLRRLRENINRFPVFLSYSSDDGDFVKQHILGQFENHMQSALELDRELICNADVHFHPARTILSEIFRCLKLCDVFVAVISTKYSKSRFCRYEIEHAHLLKKPIILIFIEHVKEEDMTLVTREVFQTFTRVQFVQEEDGCYKLLPGWEQLCESVKQLL